MLIHEILCENPADYDPNLSTGAPVPNVPYSQVLKMWDQFAQENPSVKLALDVIPVTGVPASAVDVASYADKGQYGAAAVAALGLVPGVKPLLKLAAFGLTPKQLQRHQQLVKGAKAAQTTDRAVDTTDWAAAQKQLANR